MKKDCHFRMINYVFQKVKEDVERKKKKQEENQQKRRNKKEQREKEIQIMKLRAQHSECKLKKIPERGEVQWMYWKDKEIGEYIGPGLLGPILHKLRFNLFKWEQMLMLVDKAAPYKILKIYDGLSHWCACGQIDMNARDFIAHTKEHHHGIVQKFSQINRPPWFDWIKYDDEMEKIFCFTNKENLDE